jgi:hypothetical protein
MATSQWMVYCLETSLPYCHIIPMSTCQAGTVTVEVFPGEEVQCRSMSHWAALRQRGKKRWENNEEMWVVVIT